MENPKRRDARLRFGDAYEPTNEDIYAVKHHTSVNPQGFPLRRFLNQIKQSFACSTMSDPFGKVLGIRKF